MSNCNDNDKKQKVHNKLQGTLIEGNRMSQIWFMKIYVAAISINNIRQKGNPTEVYKLEKSHRR